jgi:KipI family sensor histidine kinase inhibitor
VRILPCGPRARLIEHDDPTGYAAAVREAAFAGLIEGVVEVIPAESAVLVTADRPISDDALKRLAPLTAPPLTDEVLSIPVVYDGDDLREVADLTGLTVDEVVAAHSGATYTVAFCGFAPGFAYLTGTDDRLHLPRRDTPRTRVPAGSVAIAAGYSAVYPLASPGGWHLLGRTRVRIFDAYSDEPALLRPGTRVRFDPATSLTTSSPPPAATGSHGVATPILEVIEPGPLTLIEDLGRAGYGDIAVGGSGAFDRAAHRLANRILGNDESAAAIEALGAGLTVCALRHCSIAVTGAQGPLSIDGIPADRGAPVHLRPGQVLTLGPPTVGIRSVLAVRGGILATAILGSMSRDTLAGLGPPPLAPGDVIHGGTPQDDVVIDFVPPAAIPVTVNLTIHPGPRAHRLTPSSRSALADGVFTVGTDSDRIGVRLDGPAVHVVAGGRRASEGVVRGAVQLPPDGRPVILGPDHPVTGGYPVVGVIEDIDPLAQAGPGTPVRFTLVGW